MMSAAPRLCFADLGRDRGGSFSCVQLRIAICLRLSYLAAHLPLL